MFVCLFVYLLACLLMQVECPRFAPGDVIRVMDDREEMVKLQKGFGGWNEDMTDVNIIILGLPSFIFHTYYYHSAIRQ